MSRWDQRTEGPPRSRRDQGGVPAADRSRSRSRSLSPVERRLRQLEEERQRKETELRKLTESQRKYASSSSGSSSDSDGSDNEKPDVPPAPPNISKVGFSFQKPPPSSAKPTSTGFQLKQQPKPTAIQLKLATGPKKEPPKLLKPTANAFADDSDDEPEEMPAECRMRMRNIGRETPTSSGPNSFGKTKHGFCDSKKMFEKKLNSLHNS